MTYVLWDWNGTLLDDTSAALDTLNIMLKRRGREPISMSYYRDHFYFPVKPFYREIGVSVENEDWDALAREYHETYSLQPKHLNTQAIDALEAVKTAGVHQSIISALRQDLLDEQTVAYGVAPFMDCVYGTDNLDGASKLDRALELLAHIDATDAVLIGDALHDKEVADALKIKCVLCAQGSHAAWRLRQAAPTGETLLEAVALALE